MDIHKTLRELYEEKRRLDIAIATLDANLRRDGLIPPVKRRGRKSMSAEERKQVSMRMAKYWEQRRTQAKSLEEGPALGD